MLNISDSKIDKMTGLKIEKNVIKYVNVYGVGLRMVIFMYILNAISERNRYIRRLREKEPFN